MEIINRVHCFFEQSGTFKNEFIKKGIPAYDYDICNEYQQTDFVIDLFNEIEAAYDNELSIFDSICENDLILAFFPCVYFSTVSQICMRHSSSTYKNLSLRETNTKILERISNREKYYSLLLKLYTIAVERHFRLIIENPYSLDTYLKSIFFPPTFVDKNRMLRGDYFKKPTAYWFVNFEKKNGYSHQEDKAQKRIECCRSAKIPGTCSLEKSMISEDYARNFINDFILGTTVKQIQTELTF